MSQELKDAKTYRNFLKLKIVLGLFLHLLKSLETVGSVILAGSVVLLGMDVTVLYIAGVLSFPCYMLTCCSISKQILSGMF